MAWKTLTMQLVCFSERTGGKLAISTVVKSIANISYVKIPCHTVAIILSAISVMLPLQFQTVWLSYGACAVRKKKKALYVWECARGSASTVPEPELNQNFWHVRNSSDCPTAGALHRKRYPMRWPVSKMSHTAQYRAKNWQKTVQCMPGFTYSAHRE